MASVLKRRHFFSGLKTRDFGCIPVWRQSRQVTSCHAPAGVSSPSSALKCCTWFCHTDLCMPALCSPFRVDKQVWTSEWPNGHLRTCILPLLAYHWSSHSNITWRRESKQPCSFQVCLGVIHTWKTDLTTTAVWTKYKAPEPEVDGTCWIRLLSPPQQGLASYCWLQAPFSTTQGSVASVCSCLSLLSSLWECGCKRAEKPACTQEAQECLQNK